MHAINLPHTHMCMHNYSKRVPKIQHTHAYNNLNRSTNREAKKFYKEKIIVHD